MNCARGARRRGFDGGAGPELEGGPIQIVILDDDNVSLTLLRRVLEDAGHEAIVAADGEEALEILREGTCRLVISDWLMPGMDGLALCRRVRGEEMPAYVYFILLTSREGTESIVEGLSAGADEFLSKPFDPEELKIRVRTAERILSLETRDVTIFALAKLAESRDTETGAHIERVRDYSKLFAMRLLDRGIYSEVDAEFVRLIYLTSPLHDIGKVGIPDHILLKPDKLSDREFDVMKTHTTIGADTLTAAIRQFPSVRFLQVARDIALTHHERFDGTGYPQGLSGRDIPLCGRVVALADVYDALTSKRIYKDAYTHDLARSVIVQNKGSHFDPLLVDIFLANEDAIIEIHNRHATPGPRLTLPEPRTK